MFYLEALDAWTLPLWLAGCVYFLFGWNCLKWCLPSLFFLYFMIPLPYSVERWLSLPLQKVATDISTVLLQILGEPAISEGNTIWLGEHQLFVEEACSGLRIFVGVFALAFAYLLFTRWAWWQKLLVLFAAIPVALFANSLRIVATALLNEHASGEAARKFNHDLSGVVMIPLAAFLFWLLLNYLNRLFPEHQELDVAAVRRIAIH
jgi:exosortase